MIRKSESYEGIKLSHIFESGDILNDYFEISYNIIDNFLFGYRVVVFIDFQTMTIAGCHTKETKLLCLVLILAALTQFPF